MSKLSTIMAVHAEFKRIKKLTSKVSELAKAKADTMGKDDAQARVKGNTPEQVVARKRMANLFLDAHFSDESPETRQARLARIDFNMPLFTVNGRGLDFDNPKSKGLLGMGRKPSYMVSSKYPPKTPQEPIYALEYYSLKS
ncbi:MAG TPA: hypothetical protein VGN88_08415 [Phycisphaerae bacterium]|jgi:hypothetical protein